MPVSLGCDPGGGIKGPWLEGQTSLLLRILLAQHTLSSIMNPLALMVILALTAAGWAFPALNPLLAKTRLQRDLEGTTPAEQDATSTGQETDRNGAAAGQNSTFETIYEVNKNLFPRVKGLFITDLDVARSIYKTPFRCKTGYCLWEKNADGNVYVPYAKLEYGRIDIFNINDVFKLFAETSCIRFVPHTNESDYLSIESLDGCYSSIGRLGGKQLVSLKKYSCTDPGIIQHELMHTLGFSHEHTRTDRDDYVRVQYDNIESGNDYQFDKQKTLNEHYSTYDYGSIMHYGNRAFSKDRVSWTIVPIPDETVDIGQRSRMSDKDMTKINGLYNCEKYLETDVATSTLQTTTTTTTPRTTTTTPQTTTTTTTPRTTTTTTTPRTTTTTPQTTTTTTTPRTTTTTPQTTTTTRSTTTTTPRTTTRSTTTSTPRTTTTTTTPRTTTTRSTTTITPRTTTTTTPRTTTTTTRSTTTPRTTTTTPRTTTTITTTTTPITTTPSTMRGPIACGGTVLRGSGEIISPKYPDLYPGGVYCHWNFTGSKLSLQFIEFNVEKSPGCLKDYLGFSSGQNFVPGQMSKFCGLLNPFTIGYQNSVQMVFTTDAAVEKKGFRLHYTSA